MQMPMQIGAKGGMMIPIVQYMQSVHFPGHGFGQQFDPDRALL